MAGEVLYTPEYASWFTTLDHEQRETVTILVNALVATPLSPVGVMVVPDAAGSPVIELRPRSRRSSVRIWYALDPHRDAILLLGGDKAESGKGMNKGGASTAWSRRMFQRAATIYADYITSLAHGRRLALPLRTLPAAKRDATSDLALEIAQKTGWAVSEVVKLMKRGGPLDPDTSAGEDRILDILMNGKNRTDGLNGLGMAAYRRSRPVGSGLTVVAKRIAATMWAVTFTNQQGHSYTVHVAAPNALAARKLAIQRARDAKMPGF